MRFAAFSVHLPGLLTPEAREIAAAFAGLGSRARWTPPPDRLVRLPHPVPTARILSAHGLIAAGVFAAPVQMLERLDTAMRNAPDSGGALVLTPEAFVGLGWDEASVRSVLKGLGLTTIRRTEPGQPSFWRRRKDAVATAPIPAPPANPRLAVRGPRQPQQAPGPRRQAPPPEEAHEAPSFDKLRMRLDFYSASLGGSGAKRRSGSCSRLCARPKTPLPPRGEFPQGGHRSGGDFV